MIYDILVPPIHHSGLSRLVGVCKKNQRFAASIAARSGKTLHFLMVGLHSMQLNKSALRIQMPFCFKCQGYRK
ncbi:MAG: hypothetical protein CK528_06330 [Alcaligenaceae bacterium]|nr:MAG: hypothetical protein CK528_06330 [Alcaligenaceae bacterium]